MPLTSDTLKSAVIGSYTSKFPTSVNAVRSGKTIPFELLTSLCEAWCDVLLSPGLLQVSYIGVTGIGAAAAPPTAFTFPSAASSVTPFLAALGWTGTASIGVASSFLLDVANNSSALGIFNFLPVPSGGPGTGTPSPSIASASPSYVPLFQAALSARLQSRVGVDGLPLFDLATPQLTALITNLSNSYATILSSIYFQGVYVGSPTSPSTSPFSLILSGSIS